MRNPGDQQWDLAIFKNFSLHGQQKMQFRVEMFNFINHPNLGGPQTDITNVNFGRSITKDGNRRDIQLAIRYHVLSHRQHGSHGFTHAGRGPHPVRRFSCTADLVTAAYDPLRRLPARES